MGGGQRYSRRLTRLRREGDGAGIIRLSADVTEFHAAIAAKRHIKWRRRRRTSPAGTVSQPIGKPFNGQAKGLLWLTWRSYAGPPQYYIPPEGGALNPSGRRQPVPDRTLGAQGQRPGGAINPRPRKRASTFGNTGKHRPSPDPDRAERRLPSIFFSKGVHHESGRNYELTYPLRQHHHST